MSDHLRNIISRWRLSNFDLKIEVGRYSRPITPREDRLCLICQIIEDEDHVFTTCPMYNEIRHTYKNRFNDNFNVYAILNPLSIEDAIQKAKILLEIQNVGNSKT